MKTLNTVIKILTALAAVAGAIYVVATYGDKIVAWAKELWAALPKCPCCECTDAVADEEFEEMPVEEVPVEEVPVEAEEAPAEEAEETAAEEAPAEDPAPIVNEPVAEETDFAE